MVLGFILRRTKNPHIQNAWDFMQQCLKFYFCAWLNDLNERGGNELTLVHYSFILLLLFSLFLFSHLINHHKHTHTHARKNFVSLIFVFFSGTELSVYEVVMLYYFVYFKKNTSTLFSWCLKYIIFMNHCRFYWPFDSFIKQITCVWVCMVFVWERGNHNILTSDFGAILSYIRFVDHLSASVVWSTRLTAQHRWSIHHAFEEKEEETKNKRNSNKEINTLNSMFCISKLQHIQLDCKQCLDWMAIKTDTFPRHIFCMRHICRWM